MANILITGGAGFIGSNLAESLDNGNNHITIFDNFYYGKPNQIGNLNEKLRHSVYKIDVRNDSLKIEYELERNKPDYIFHLAALSSAPQCTQAPKDAVEVNVNGFQNMLEAADHYKVKKVVYASTSSMYQGHTLPWNEEMCIRPRTIYEASFHDREALAYAYYHEFGVKSVGLRFFSVYGPNESHKRKYANNITQFLWDLQQDKRPIVYGDGKQSRDFVHVDDVVDALKHAAFSEHMLLDCNIINIGTGISTSFNQIIKLLNVSMGKQIQPEYFSNPINNYVHNTKSDISKARNLLKWEPKISLTDGIDMQIQHYGSN
jgi:UDP-glucose 4-epimerase